MSTPRFNVYAAGLTFPEGPIIDADGNLFVCCRRPVGYIAKITPDRKVQRLVDTGGKPQALALAPDGQIYLADAERREILMLSATGQLDVLLPRKTSHELIGPNDLCFGDSDTIYFTDPGLEWGVFHGRVYRYHISHRQLECLVENLGFPNGLAVTADERWLLVAETLTNRLLCLDLHDSSLPPQPVFDFGDDAVPDGMEWIGTDCLAVALHGCGQISILSTRDWTETRWTIDAQAQPTNLTVRDGRLFVTDDLRQAVLVARLPP